MLQYKNTPDPDTKQSPALIVFGRNLRDFTPILQLKYKPASVWTLTAENRGAALSKRHCRERERLSEHSSNLPPLKVGDNVYVQNQVGNRPLKWDKSGTIVEVKQYDQYNVKMDGSGRLSLRNRQFLRKFTPYSLPMKSHQSTHHPMIQETSDNYDSQLSENSSANPPSSNHQPTLDQLPIAMPTSIQPSTEQIRAPQPKAVVTENSTPSQSPPNPLQRSTRIRQPNSLFKDYDMS